MNIRNTIALKRIKEIKNICAPLLKLDAIQYFIYAVNYSDDTRLYLSDNPDWLIGYHEDLYNLGASNKLSPNIKKSIMSWLDFPDKRIFDIAKSQYDMDYPFFLLNSEKKSCEIGIFGFHPNMGDAATYAYKNRHLLRKFIYYFKTAGQHIINEAQKDRSVLPRVHKQNEMIFTDSCEDQLYEWLTENTKKYFFGNHGSCISQKELGCIQLLLKGKNTKEIGKILNLSSRTIETHLEKARNKLNAKNSMELIFKAIRYHLVDWRQAYSAP